MWLASSIEIVARLPQTNVHAWTDGGLLCSSGNEILRIEDLADPRPEVVGRVPWHPWERIATSRFVDRIAKFSILQVCPTNHGMLVSTGRSWWRVAGNTTTRIASFATTRPMNRGICAVTSGEVYVAEYALNRRRSAVRIFRSSDLESFDVAWEFPAGAIRHVHAVIDDSSCPGRIWVLTGDRDHESGIYFTDDSFRTLQCFARSGQTTRATDLLLRRDDLIWGMDAPDTRPYVVRARRDRPASLEFLCELSGPAYYMAQNRAGGIYLGTTAEPGRAVRDRRAHAFRLDPDNRAEEILWFDRDWLPQHGILHFPSGVLPENYIAFTQRALKPNEGCLTIARDRLWG